jgi:crotonobetainyl-CoA:carnitine CoA-transferase CaiB-like acyl-CoA transferase
MFKTASEQYRMLFGIVQTPEDLATCHQLEARGFYHTVDHPVIGRIRVPFRLWNMSVAGPACHRAAPLLGQHTAEVLGQLGCSGAEIAALRELGVIRGDGGA